MSKPQNQAGFSLLEALLSSVLLLVVFAVGGSLLLRLQRSAASYNERARQHSDAGLSLQTLTHDVEAAGTQLALPANSRLAGQMPVPFAPNEAYEITPERITRRSPAPAEPLLAAVTWHGAGELSWRGNAFDVQLRGARQSSRVVFDGRDVTVEENGEPRARRSASAESLFSFQATLLEQGDAAPCRLAYLADGQVIYVSAGECPAQPALLVELASDGYLAGMTLDAAHIVLSATDSARARLPLLPLYNDRRLTSPLFCTERGFVLFQAEERREPLFTAQAEIILRPGERTELPVTEAADVVAGDRLLLADYANQRSALLEVLENGGDGRLLIQPVTERRESEDGWDRFYSAPEDFDGFTFARGTRVVKLAPPVEYASQQEDDGQTALYRRAGGAAWQLVIPHLQNFLFTELASPERLTYEVSFAVVSEGAENAPVTQPVRLSLSPRALNRTLAAQ